MSATDAFTAPGEEHAVPYSKRGPASIESTASFGFWLFLLSDVVMFSGLFAAYAVLADRTAGGPEGADLFDRGYVMLETMCLLPSRLPRGPIALAVESPLPPPTFLVAGVTFVLGGAFLGLEI